MRIDNPETVKEIRVTRTMIVPVDKGDLALPRVEIDITIIRESENEGVWLNGSGGGGCTDVAGVGAVGGPGAY